MQKSIEIVDGSGQEVLDQLCGAFETLATDFSGGTEPQPTYEGQKWLDTSTATPVLKQRNVGNTEWVILGTFDEEGFHPANTVSAADETVTKKGNTFNGADQLLLLDNQGRIPMLNGSLITNLTLPTSTAKTHFLEAGSDHSKVLMKGGTALEVDTSEGTKLFNLIEDTEFSFTQLLDAGTPLAGKDYSMFLVPNGAGGLEVKFSLNATAPEGYAMSDVLRIGGHHTMCQTITSSNAPSTTHPAVGYNAGEIVPNAIWDIINRPKCSPNGMGYVDLIDLWVDIYNQGGKDGAETSVFGATRICSRQWEDHAEDMRLVGKRLLWDHEFSVAAEGSPQKVAVKGAAQPSPDTTGGHMATNNLYMISKYFLWEMCGLQWQWLANVGANGSSGWGTHDSLSGAKGQLYGASYALLAGGPWHDSSSCGSRSRCGANGRGTVAASSGGRGACEPLNSRTIIA